MCRRSRGRAAVTAQAVAMAVIIATARAFQKMAFAVQPRGAASKVTSRKVSVGANAKTAAPSAYTTAKNRQNAARRRSWGERSGSGTAAVYHNCKIHRSRRSFYTTPRDGGGAAG